MTIEERIETVLATAAVQGVTVLKVAVGKESFDLLKRLCVVPTISSAQRKKIENAKQLVYNHIGGECIIVAEDD
jgi:hypothetical protein